MSSSGRATRRPSLESRPRFQAERIVVVGDVCVFYSTCFDESMSMPSVLGPRPPSLLRMVTAIDVVHDRVVADVDGPEAGAGKQQAGNSDVGGS